MAAFAQPVAIGVVQFGRKRPLAHAGCIGFHDPQHEVDRPGAKAHACRGLPRDHVRRGDEGIGAEIDVQQRALRPFEEDALTGAALFLHDLPDRSCIFQDLGRDRLQIGDQRVAVNGVQPQPGAQRIVMDKRPVHPQGKGRIVAQVGDADHPAAHLVLIGRPDPATRGADLGDRILAFPRAVQFTVEGQDQRRVLGDHQRLGRDVHALRADRVDFLQQMPRVQHDAIADHAQLAGPHDARRQRMQLVDRAVDDQRMTGIVTALEPRDDIGALAQPVDDLALALVAPLGADHHHVGHVV